jgi:hypothetical protein
VLAGSKFPNQNHRVGVGSGFRSSSKSSPHPDTNSSLAARQHENTKGKKNNKKQIYGLERSEMRREKKRNCRDKLCFELSLNNKLRICVVVGEGFMTNLCSLLSSVQSLLCRFSVSSPVEILLTVKNRSRAPTERFPEDACVRHSHLETCRNSARNCLTSVGVSCQESIVPCGR